MTDGQDVQSQHGSVLRGRRQCSDRRLSDWVSNITSRRTSLDD
jgi:hypothetical protein